MLKFALVGCGRIAKRHSELLGLNKIKNVKQKKVDDINISNKVSWIILLVNKIGEKLYAIMYSNSLPKDKEELLSFIRYL